MTNYQLLKPVRAVRYERNVNERELYALLNVQGGGSFSNATGHFVAQNLRGSITKVEVHEGQWLVAIRSGFVVLDDAEFNAQFAEVQKALSASDQTCRTPDVGSDHG